MDGKSSPSRCFDDERNIQLLPEAVLLHIFSNLNPRDLFVVGTCSKAWYKCITRENKMWKAWYKDRWKPASCDVDGILWFTKFSSKMDKLGSWAGRYNMDSLYGHAQGVRSCKLLNSCGLLLTGSLDRTVRLWDLSAGVAISTSKPHGGTVRCVALDEDMAVSGCVDKTLRVWASNLSEGDDACSTSRSFDLSSPPSLSIKEHTGPISSICLSDQALYSGSWDCTVRCYSRHSSDFLHLGAVYQYNDWVNAVVSRGKHLLVAAGSEVFCQDLGTGQVVRKFMDLHQSGVQSLEGSQNSKILYTAAGEGLVMAHDLRMKNPSRILWHHNSGVLALSFEDPWLATAASDGSVTLVNTEANHRASSSSSSCSSWHATRRSSVGIIYRQLHSPAGPAYCVDIADQRVVCGSESQTVRVWDFTHAKARAQQAALSKQSRGSRGHSRQRFSHGSVQSNDHSSHYPFGGSVSANLDRQQALLGTSPPNLPPVIESMSEYPRATRAQPVRKGARKYRSDPF
ncbi:hypothetical protein CEUSTIGMA_g7332.t1 [Chlamydomonas eustigma]|uniref:F-box domain-containing protein n=1 Tax=Chlamydomonas eustigma TaxID=1157962 RepID=A0A250XAK6_9CHLO|nr:hypothetical protein CEUSTIGMA_g7332.t1 [Chlamydomonas eustigma]|eukprot:GAX79892.1 hypothetical protein CEUSTIGMA_g7332.t1 [Chlamydomonas eustigma]